jgi:DNA mismatch repair protein MutL
MNVEPRGPQDRSDPAPPGAAQEAHHTRRPILALDDVTISRIAAGEVVERPASVVKELIENSLDAGATVLRIEILAGGKRLIVVGDDGDGIPADQMERAVARHATSKLRDAADLERVATLGFRGEALAAIAAVSHFSLTSRARGSEHGVRLRMDGGRLVGREAIGAPVGTTIRVENLFHAVPARRAFLSGDAAEAARVTRVVTRYALAHPERRFELVRNERTALRTPGDGDLRNSLAQVFTPSLARDMLTVAADKDERNISVSGFVSPPHVHRANRTEITLFVNGRWIEDPRLAYAVTESYHAMIPARRYPLAVLMIEMPPEAVDVNAHPAKTEVRFREPGAVFRAVQRAVRATVTGTAPVAPLRPARPGTPPSAWRSAASPPSQAGGALRERLTPPPGWAGQPGAVSSPGDEAAPSLQPRRGSTPAAPAAARSSLPPLRVLGQVGASFIVAEGPQGLYLIDQHAAHERVMYERFMARQEPMVAQHLLAAVVVEIGVDGMAALEQQGPSLRALGFDIEAFGPEQVVVRAVPEVVAAPDVDAAVQAVFEELAVGDDPVGRALEERLVRAVCKRATVKAGQTLAVEEMRSLLRDLEACAAPHSCPHGRPTMIVLGRDELERQFGRG